MNEKRRLAAQFQIDKMWQSRGGDAVQTHGSQSWIPRHYRSAPPFLAPLSFSPRVLIMRETETRTHSPRLAQIYTTATDLAAVYEMVSWCTCWRRDFVRSRLCPEMSARGCDAPTVSCELVSRPLGQLANTWNMVSHQAK